MKKVINIIFLLAIMVSAQQKEEAIVQSYDVVDLAVGNPEEYDVNFKRERVDLLGKKLELHRSDGQNLFLLANKLLHIASTGGFIKMDYFHLTNTRKYYFNYIWIGTTNVGYGTVELTPPLAIFRTKEIVLHLSLGEEIIKNIDVEESNEEVKSSEEIIKNIDVEEKSYYPIGFVRDLEGVFSIEEVQKLEEYITWFEEITTNQIAVVSTSTIGDYKDFNKFAIDVSNFLGVGLKEKNNGLTIVLSKNLGKIRINSGIGTESKLSDEFLKNVLDEFIIPEFKKGNFYEGVEKGIKQIMKQWIMK